MWKVRILPGRMSILNPCWWEFLGGALTSFDGTLWEPRIEQLLGGSWRFSLSMFCEMLKDDQFSMILIWLRLMMFGIIHSLTSLTHDLNDLITYEVTTLKYDFGMIPTSKSSLPSIQVIFPLYPYDKHQRASSNYP